MPILKPDIAKALRSAGLSNETGEETLEQLMDKKGLTTSALLDDLKDFIETSTNEPLRLKAIETDLQHLTRWAILVAVTAALAGFTLGLS